MMEGPDGNISLPDHVFHHFISVCPAGGRIKKGERSVEASVLERKIPGKPSESIAEKNLNNILKQAGSSRSVFGTADPQKPEISTHVETLQYQVNSFNSNTLYRMQANGQGIQLNKRK